MIPSPGKGRAAGGRDGGGDGAGDGRESASWAVDVGSDVVRQGLWWWGWQRRWLWARLGVCESCDGCW